MLSWTRRTACLSALAAPLILRSGLAHAQETELALTAIERRLGGRLGVSVGTQAGVLLSHRVDELFPMCSTFKVLAAAAVLARIDAGTDSLDRVIAFGPGDLLSYAPITRKTLDAGGGTGRMTLSELCAAALEWSDNSAANLLLTALGGPEALTRWLRSIGDPVTRLDRDEPTLNTALPGDPRDTTSPAAMRDTLGRVLLGSVLSAASRGRLEAWMVASRTGLKRIRAGLPPDWPVGDKTGTGDNGTFNDVAILRPPGHAPVFACVYITGAQVPAEAVEAAYAEIGRLVAARVGAA
ncbi:class A beta-lactamase [Methylobacterium pseudosasicola]|uniref:Beta-lactamase n=1 Tax=Methylobacterium pseudosasicola TaxID=582667 RepID=A0A1I4S0G7_9HYPH|nr:class A beta-lactamase [Methylobacterium pseudosasicola]SFM57931.1 beta-lactamase class A [Methylobacterium pseudosasicola]